MTMFPAIIYHSENDKYIGAQVIALPIEQLLAYELWRCSHE